MASAFLKSKLSKLSKLLSDTKGHVAVIFGLAVIPIISIIGFTIDFQQTTTQKNKVQVAVDSAVLAGARAMQSGKTHAQIRTLMKSYLTAQHENISTGGRLTCGDIEVTFGTDSQDIAAAIRCAQETSLLQVVGVKKMEFDVVSTSTYGIGKLDVAFMFDVSGSMASEGRMTKLKSAAKEAVDTLLPPEGGAGTEDVRIAMISYNDMVNAGDYFSDVTGLANKRTYYATNTWVERVRVPPYEETYQEWTCEREWKCTKRYTSGRRKGQCRRGYWQSGNCGYKPATRPAYNYDDIEHSAEVSREVNSTCVWERRGDREFTDFAPGSGDGASSDPALPTEPAPTGAKSKIYGANKPIYNAADPEGTNPRGYLSAGYAYWDDDANQWYQEGTSCRNHKPVPLTKNRGTLTGYITSLTTGGGTAGHQGIAWSWYMIAEPWKGIHGAGAAPLNYDEPDSVKAVILMSDGAFLHQEHDEMGTSTEQARRVCDAMKDQGEIIIYSVAFQAPQAGKDILDYCASGPEFSFSPDSGEELTQAYKAIATSISDLRIKF